TYETQMSGGATAVESRCARNDESCRRSLHTDAPVPPSAGFFGHSPQESMNPGTGSRVKHFLIGFSSQCKLLHLRLQSHVRICVLAVGLALALPIREPVLAHFDRVLAGSDVIRRRVLPTSPPSTLISAPAGFETTEIFVKCDSAS